MLDLNCSQTNMREQTIQANCSNESGFAFFFQQMNISYLNNVKCKSVTETLQFTNNNSRVCFKKKDGTKIILYLLVLEYLERILCPHFCFYYFWSYLMIFWSIPKCHQAGTLFQKILNYSKILPQPKYYTSSHFPKSSMWYLISSLGRYFQQPIEIFYCICLQCR